MVKQSIQYLHRLVLACCILSALCSCQNSDNRPLRIGTNTWPGYAPLYLAEAKQLYKPALVHMVELASASDVMHAFRTGTIDIAALTLDEALTLYVESAIDFRVILILDISYGGDSLIVKPAIRNLTELNGKRIAVESTAVGALVLHSALIKGQVETQMVELVNCESANHLQCFPEVDAIVTFEPNRSNLLSQGAKEIFSSRDMNGLIQDVLIVNDVTWQNHKDELSNIVSGYFSARVLMDENLQQAYQYMQPYMGIDYIQFQHSLNGLHLLNVNEMHDMLSGSPSKLDDTVKQLNKLMHDADLLHTERLLTTFSDAQFLPGKTL